YYRLKERNIPHVKIADANEIKVWYNFAEKIGQGGFGVVLAVTEKSTSKKWAMKIVTKATVDERSMQMVQREIQILKLIQHPHIIYLDKVYETPKKIYMIIERCYGVLAKIYNERKPFIEKIAKKIIKQLAEAVAYLHKHDIVHRDLKMENILMGENPSDPTDEYYIKLTDFGLSIVKYGKGVDSMLHDYCGTLFYMAPEIIDYRSYSQQCDMWAVGVILYMLVAGKYPFYSTNEKELQQQIRSSDPDFSNMQLSVEITDLILLLMTKDPANRVTAAEMLNHPWLQNKKLSKAIQSNILKMMKDWKSEMKMPAGQESDWVAAQNDITENKAGKQQMNLPKTNINFDRSKKPSDTSRENDNDVKRFPPSKPQVKHVPQAAPRRQSGAVTKR
ncbi:serine/threonine-protein kinase 33-like, partial [Asbolus verrucosus]